MGYNNLSDSGMTDAERRNEATRLVKMIEPHIGTQNPETYAKILTQRERNFIAEISNERKPVSHKQLFWLRDLKDRLI
jgi:hypothetical protein